MPKSKRETLVTLAKATRKGKERKQQIIEEIRSEIDDHNSLYVFHYENMRNSFLKDARSALNGRIFMGKNKVMMVALGRSAEEEHAAGLHTVAAHLTGDCGLFITDMPKEDVQKYFREFRRQGFAKEGQKATQTIRLPAGPLQIVNEAAEGEVPAPIKFAGTMEPLFRSLGLPTTLKSGEIHLTREHVVCRVGDTLTAEQCKLLKQFHIMMADMRMTLRCAWTKEGGFESLDGSAVAGEEEAEEKIVAEDDE
ncbi:putative mRNA turnover protein 4 [Paratrimastix pyriformis]|uniref:Ribosome assembly factor mrt4 n=1 Tax=Paratrimastix pyriformis TaxID=342808 RepID=A0ABQ8UUV4_9EUKA|nr:putative mRNA turnover protein 4 [Paratrimastix pyriformis]